MTSNVLPTLQRRLPGFIPGTLTHVTRTTLKIIEAFNNCLGNIKLVSSQTLLDPKALKKARTYYIMRENLPNISDEPDYTTGSERYQHIAFLNHLSKEINPNVQGILTDSHLITYLKEHQMQPIT